MTIAASGGVVVGSILSVAGNVSRGAVTGNSATNALSVDAASITGDLGGVGLLGEATHVRANTQSNYATQRQLTPPARRRVSGAGHTTCMIVRAHPPSDIFQEDCR